MQQLSPAMQTRIKQQEYKINNPSCSNPNITEANEIKFKQLNEDVVSLSQNNEFDYSFDDGVISDVEKIKNFGKGIISPITNMFSSPKNFLIGAGMIAAGAALTIATGGAIAPLFVALGVTGGAVQLGVSAYKVKTAKTDEEARQAWQGMGAGTSSIVGSVAGSKAALKGAGVDTKGMNALTATVECFKQVPNAASKSIGAFTSGQALVNIKNVFKSNKVASANDTPEAKPKTEVNSQVTETKAGNEVLDTQIEPQTQIDTPEIKQQADVEIKPVENVSEAKVEPKTTLKQEHDVPEFQQQVTDTTVESSKNATSSNIKAVKTQAQETPLVQEIVKEDGTKITLTRNENGQITESIIKRPNKTTTYKTYENGKCVDSMTFNKARPIEGMTFNYDSNNGKIVSIDVTNTNGQTLKEFTYDDGKLQTYNIKQSKTGTIETYNPKGELISSKSDFSEEIKAAVEMLEHDKDFSGYKGSKDIVRKTKLLNRTTGQYEDVYIASNGSIYNSNSESLGHMILLDAGSDTYLDNFSPIYKQKDFIDLHELKTINCGSDKSPYRGIGTELVKQAIIESYKKGHGGRIYINAANFTQQGRMAEGFYSHIGLIAEAPGSNRYACPEYLIAEFLTK